MPQQTFLMFLFVQFHSQYFYLSDIKPSKTWKKNTILNRLTQICGYADDILVIARSLPALDVLCIELSRAIRPNI